MMHGLAIPKSNSGFPVYDNTSSRVWSLEFQQHLLPPSSW